MNNPQLVSPKGQIPKGGRVRGSARAFVRKLHLWLGLSAGLLLCITGLTGSLLVFYPEIDTLIHAENRSASNIRPQSWAAVDQSLRREFPGRPGAWRLEVTEDGGAIPARYFPVDAQGDRALKPFLVWVDPRTYSVIRDARWGSEPMTWIYDLHRRLLLDLPGATAMGIFALTFLPLLLGSGLWAWWPRAGSVWKSLKFPKGATGAKRLYGFHKLVGLASLSVLPILAITGAMLNLPDVSRGALSAVSPLVTNPAPASTPVGKALLLDDLLARAEHAFPGAEPAWIETPGTAEGAVQITFAQAHEPSRRFPRTIVWLDQYSGAILATRDPRADGAGDVVLNWLHPIHAGELLGLPGRLALFATGLLPSVLLLTGWLRYRRRKRL